MLTNKYLAFLLYWNKSVAKIINYHALGALIIHYDEIEAKWQGEWDKAKLSEPVINEKEPFLVAAAFMYVNSPMHIGHLRAFGTADVHARYKRMRGFNVLYPMGFHGTGTPVLAFAKRIKEKDKDLIEDFKMFHIKDEDISKMSDPEYIISYFSKEVEKGMRLAGFSIDWKRKFITTEPLFSKFIEWQFSILNKKGYLVKGKHPVGWCTNENNAVGMHDTKHDVEPEIEKETAIKFKIDGEDAFIACATYRPETLFGVTNLFVNENSKYALCRINDQLIYLSKEAADVLKYQMEVSIGESIDGKELLKKSCVNPLTNERIPILPGFFVKAKLGTGAVMSVPAHAPFDYAALMRLRASNYPMPQIVPKKVIDVKIGRSLSDVAVGEAKPVHLDIPSLAYLEILNTNTDAIDDMLEFATKLEYREESHWGKMTVEGYEGMSEPQAREDIKAKLLAAHQAFEIYIIANSPVVCRCGTEVIVKIVDDQWFINYGNKEWKDETRYAFKNVKIFPEKLRKTYEAAVDWIDLRAVARAQGLGTKFPLDKKYIIESLSDSTIYMAFYTMLPYLRDIDPEKLKLELFDYIVLGTGTADGVASSTGIDFDVIKKCRESFAYWYKNTSNHSGADLVFNHLTMYVYNHVAIMNKENWPSQIITNGSVLSEGEKMSKSLGNIVPLSDAISSCGADPLRFTVVAGADLYSDSEYNTSAVNGVKSRLEYLWSVVENIDSYESEELKNIDYWLYSKLNRKIRTVTNCMENLELREASTQALYNSIIELKKYFERGGKNAIVIRDYVNSVILLIQPIAPYVAEELWHKLGNDTFVSRENWPVYQENLINDKIEMLEDNAESVISDCKNTMEIMLKKSKEKPRGVRIIVASEWKREVGNMLAASKDVSKTIASAKEKKLADPEKIASYIAKLAKRMNELRSTGTSQKEELDSLVEARDYISKSLGVEVIIEDEDQSKSARADRAMPLKPSIEIS